MKNRIIVYVILTIILCGLLYFNKNAPIIYGNIANNYYKKNNIEKATSFYEKSFKLGNESSVHRDAYVNLIINSPLNLESQLKLVTIVEDKIDDIASKKAEKFLNNLKNEIYNSYPDNYIQQAPFNQKIVRWTSFPISYKFINTSGVPDYFVTEIDKAFLEWERNCNLMFQLTKKENADIIIDFKNLKQIEPEYGQKYVVAYTVPFIEQNILKKMVMNFYVKNPLGEYFSANQVYNTALHEIFHALGFLGHSYNPDDIMYLSKDSEFGDDSRAFLSDADINTLSLLYKIKPDITNRLDLHGMNGEYIPYLVLGNAEEVKESKRQEAQNYIYHAPALPGGYIDLAESLVAEERYSEAITKLEKALYLADTDEIKYIVLYNLAVTYYYINHAEMALMYLEKAEEIKQSDELKVLKAEIYLKNADDRKSLNIYNELLEKYPDKQEYVINCANLYIKQKKYMAARKILKSYLKRNPKQKENSKFRRYKFLIW